MAEFKLDSKVYWSSTQEEREAMEKLLTSLGIPIPDKPKKRPKDFMKSCFPDLREFGIIIHRKCELCGDSYDRYKYMRWDKKKRCLVGEDVTELPEYIDKIEERTSIYCSCPKCKEYLTEEYSKEELSLMLLRALNGKNIFGEEEENG